MSDFDTPPSDQTPETPVAFCQNCGKPLNKETVRKVGPAVYCEPCLAARLGGQPTDAPGYTPVNPGAPGSAPNSPWSAFRPPTTPNPGLAAALGLIPGVGAMYNEQYAKGIVHLLIFAVLVTLANSNGIFGLFVAGWIIYMAMEAHHTAKAKRDGAPLPNPFGLNDIGERMGFGPDWTVASAANAARDAVHATGFQTPPPTNQSATGPASANPNAQAYSAPQTPPWGAPADAYTPPPPTAYPPYGAPIPPFNPTYSAPYPPHSSARPPTIFATPAPSRFPAGAVWLIALGVLFLLGTEGIFSGFRGETLIGLLILASGAWVFVRRMTETGPIENDGSPHYQFRLLYALRPSIWLLLLGALFLFDSLNILHWSHSWPFFIIIAGIMMLLNRATVPTSVPYTPVHSDPPAPPTRTPGTGLAPLHLDDPTDPATGGR